MHPTEGFRGHFYSNNLNDKPYVWGLGNRSESIYPTKFDLYKIKMKYEKYRQNTHHLTALNHLTMTHCTDGIYVEEFIMPTSGACSLIYYLSFQLFIYLRKS